MSTSTRDERRFLFRIYVRGRMEGRRRCDFLSLEEQQRHCAERRYTQALIRLDAARREWAENPSDSHAPRRAEQALAALEFASCVREAFCSPSLNPTLRELVIRKVGL